MSNGNMVNNLGNVMSAVEASRAIDDAVNYDRQNAAQFYETNLANMANSRFPSMPINPGRYENGPIGTGGYNLGTEAAEKAYSQQPDVIADRYLRQQYNLAFPNGRPQQPTDSTEVPPPKVEANDAEKTAFEKEVSMAGTIEQLLNELKKLASMEPGEGHPIFQLDSLYKGSNPITGPSVEPMQTPMADGRALTTFNLGNK